MTERIVELAEDTVAVASVRHLAEMAVVYYSTLQAGGFPEDKAFALTYRWHDANLFGTELVVVEPDEDDEEEE